MSYMIVRQRNVYTGTLGINGHAHIVLSDDGHGKPLEFETIEDAQAWIDEEESGIYCTMRGEAGAPEYWIVGDDAWHDFVGRCDDGSNYNWDGFDGCEECGPDDACGECDACSEFRADQDDKIFADARIEN